MMETFWRYSGNKIYLEAASILIIHTRASIQSVGSCRRRNIILRRVLSIGIYCGIVRLYLKARRIGKRFALIIAST